MTAFIKFMRSSVKFWTFLILLMASSILAQSPPNEISIMLPGDVPLDLVKIPSGSFMMGVAELEAPNQYDEMPQHAVTFANDFYMGKTEVTQAQWLAVMETWPHDAPTSTSGEGDNYPAYYLTWGDVAGPGGFIETLNQHLVDTGQGNISVRLPSEAEWEYACRAGTQTRFFFGNSTSAQGEVCNDAAAGVLPGNRTDYMWFCSEMQCGEVSTKLPNKFGLYDMSGNMWEWCQDVYRFDYNGAPDDGSVWDYEGEVTTDTMHVLRGGTWDYYAQNCRSANRFGQDDYFLRDTNGFRLAADGQTALGIKNPDILLYE